MKEWHKLLWIIGIFLGAYFIPWESTPIRQAGLEAFMMLQDYARQHVLTCLIPAFSSPVQSACLFHRRRCSSISAQRPIRFSPIRWLPCPVPFWRFVPVQFCRFSRASIRAARALAPRRHFCSPVPPLMCWQLFSPQRCWAGNSGWRALSARSRLRSLQVF